MARMINILGFVFFVAAILSPLAQLTLVFPEPDLYDLRREMQEEWILSERNLLLGAEVTDRTLNPEIAGTENEFYDSGVPVGRSHPETDTGLGAEVVVDGKIIQAEGDTTNPFWSFRSEQFPVQLIIEPKTDRDSEESDDRDTVQRYNWICVVPRGDWQIALSADVLIPRSEGPDEWVPKKVVPLHYQGPRPVVYHFRQEHGIGVRLVITDAKIAINNHWWAPIFEVAAGWEDIK